MTHDEMFESNEVRYWKALHAIRMALPADLCPVFTPYKGGCASCDHDRSTHEIRDIVATVLPIFKEAK